MKRREDKLIWESMRGEPPASTGREHKKIVPWKRDKKRGEKYDKLPHERKSGEKEHNKTIPRKRDKIPHEWKPGEKEHKKTIPWKRDKEWGEKYDKLPHERKSGPIRRDVNEAPEPPNFAAEARVLEGVNCSCKDCVHWVEGDLCGAREISLSKVPNDDYGAVVICETFEAGRSDER